MKRALIRGPPGAEWDVPHGKMSWVVYYLDIKGSVQALYGLISLSARF